MYTTHARTRTEKYVAALIHSPSLHHFHPALTQQYIVVREHSLEWNNPVTFIAYNHLRMQHCHSTFYIIPSREPGSPAVNPSYYKAMITAPGPVYTCGMSCCLYDIQDQVIISQAHLLTRTHMVSPLLPVKLPTPWTRSRWRFSTTLCSGVFPTPHDAAMTFALCVAGGVVSAFASMRPYASAYACGETYSAR